MNTWNLLAKYIGPLSPLNILNSSNTRMKPYTYNTSIQCSRPVAILTGFDGPLVHLKSWLRGVQFSRTLRILCKDFEV